MGIGGIGQKLMVSVNRSHVVLMPDIFSTIIMKGVWE